MHDAPYIWSQLRGCCQKLRRRLLSKATRRKRKEREKI